MNSASSLRRSVLESHQLDTDLCVEPTAESSTISPIHGMQLQSAPHWL